MAAKVRRNGGATGRLSIVRTDWAEVYRSCYQALVRFLYRKVWDEDRARDLAQEAFARALGSNPDNPRAWVFQVAVGLGWLSNDRLRSGPDVGTATALAEGEADVAASPPAPTGAESDELAADAESPHVQGRVIAEDGRPLASALVTIQGGSTVSGLSGRDGTFSLPVPEDSPMADSARLLAITVQGMGFRSATLELDPRVAHAAPLEFQLERIEFELGETVVSVGRPREAPAAGGVAGEPDELWTPATITHAESRADFAVMLVPELPVLEIELGELRGVVAVRVRQTLDSGATLTLVQQRAADVAGEPTLPADQPADTLERNGLRITGSAPIAIDSLRVLLDRVR